MAQNVVRGHWQGVWHNMTKAYTLSVVGPCPIHEEARWEFGDLVPTASQLQVPLQVGC